MNRKLLSTAALLALLAPAAPAESLDPAERVLDVAVTGMRDGAGVGEQLIELLDAKGVGREIRPGQKQVSDVEGVGDRQKITLSPAIAALSPRYAALHLAQSAAQIQLQDMPDCAEKEFMVLSLTVRSWLEMGGDRTQLPLFDGIRDEAMARKVETWFSSNMDSYVRDAKAKGRPTLSSLRAEKESQLARAVCESEEQGLYKDLAWIQKQNERAASFAKDETEWLLARRGTYP